ncbi:MAG: glycosyl transferase 2 family protein [Gemmatimonadetes bacterium]|nr:glycosyl transferase 2 family protein [Gemmatimonadota bacterium]
MRPALSAYTIPRLPRSQELAIRGIALGAYGYGVYWIIWRWHSSLNWEHPAFSLVLVLAETFGLISMAFFIFTAWRLEHREPPPCPDGLSVDVFITCYDEPLQLLRRTAIGARAIRYPHTTYILDDGKRDEVKAMADGLGIGYIRREGNAHAKAGNLNHAFSVTSGEFVLQLDADHVPLPNILDRLLGYFNEPRLAFVQSPQDFYNTDSFTHVENDEGRQMWEENRLFFSLIQPGKDRMNAAFFCGSCGVLRRTAFEEIGGFSVQTITEDMETSMLLHARGWKSCYHGETLAYGLAPASAAQYHVQRLRWGQGSMQILRKMNPLFVPGLSWKQKISYFSSVIVYLDGAQRLVFYLAPVVFFLFGILPVKVDNHALLIRLVPYMFLTVGSFELLSRGTGYILISERFNMTRFWTYVLALSGYFAKKPLKFNVTPKGAGDVPFKTYAPQLYLAIISFSAFVWALVARHLGWIDYHDGGGMSTAFLVNGAWLVWNLYFALYVVRHSIQSRQLRGDHRFAQRLPTRIQVVMNGEATGDALPATTENINSSGLSFRSTSSFDEGALLDIPLQLATGDVVARGHVTHRASKETPYGMVYSHGVVFHDMSLDMRDAIELHSAHHAIPLSRQAFRQSVDVVANTMQRLTNPRAGKRRVVALPALVSTSTDAGDVELGIGLLEEESRGGVRLILEHPVDPGTAIRWDVPGTNISGRGTAVFSRALESQLRLSFVVGVQRMQEPRSSIWRRAKAEDRPSR